MKSIISKDGILVLKKCQMARNVVDLAFQNCPHTNQTVFALCIPETLSKTIKKKSKMR